MPTPTKVNYYVKVSELTRQLLLVLGTPSGDHEVVGPVIQNAILQDEDGNQVEVSPAGGLKVSQKDLPEWYGKPEYAVDAAAETNDSYYDLMTLTKDCTSVSLYVETNDAIISFDGGTTDQFFLDVDAGQVVLTGLNLPVGTVISGKNAVVGSDYTNLRIAAW